MKWSVGNKLRILILKNDKNSGTANDKLAQLVEHTHGMLMDWIRIKVFF